MAGPLGSAPGIMVGVGVGTAAAAAIEPLVEPGKQQAWANHPNRVLDAALMARLVAEGGVDLAAARDDAAREGFSADKLDALVYLSQTVPGVGEALRILRRDPAFADLFTHSLVKQGFDARYFPHLTDLQHERLDPAVIAVAIQRTLLANDGILPNQPDTAGSNVPPMPLVALDPETEALAAGIDLDRLKVLTRIVGLPASPDLAARMHFRQLITEGAFNQAILEGNTRGEWAPFLLEGFREILTAGQYAELQLRGFLTATERRAQTAKHGMSDADSDLLYNVMGRSIPVHQIVTGEARGGTYGGPTGNIPAEFLASVERSNLRPEYFNLAYANRYSYPSAFVVRSLLTDGAITQAEGEQIFLDVGWRPDLAHKVATHYAPSAVAVADPDVKKAQTQLWGTTHRSYIAEEIGDTVARQQLTALGIAQAAQDQIMALWQAERGLTRERLSLTQIKKAYQGAVINPATGVAWSANDVTQALLDRGYSANDAAVILAEW